MPKLPSVRKHAKGYFFIRIQGKDHYLGSDKPRANAQAKLLLADYLRDQPVSRSANASSEMTIEEIAVEFLLDEKKKYENADHDTGSFDRCRRSIKILLDVYGKDKPSQFGPLALKQLREVFVQKGLARTTINTRINIIRSCFRWAAENEYCSASVYQSLQTVRGIQRSRAGVKEGRKVDPVAPEIVELTIPHLPSVIADLVRFQWHSGMRSSEMLKLRACDIDMTKGDIWRYSPVAHKGTWRGKERVVFFGPRCQEILKKYLARVGDDTEKFLFSPKESVEEHKRKRRAERKTKVQPSQQTRMKANPRRAPGDKYRRDSYRNAILRACERANVPHWFPHQLRHLAGTLAREVEGLDGAQHYLGHSHSKVSEQYSIIRDAKGEAVARKIG